MRVAVVDVIKCHGDDVRRSTSYGACKWPNWDEGKMSVIEESCIFPVM